MPRFTIGGPMKSLSIPAGFFMALFPVFASMVILTPFVGLCFYIFLRHTMALVWSKMEPFDIYDTDPIENDIITCDRHDTDILKAFKDPANSSKTIAEVREALAVSIRRNILY